MSKTSKRKSGGESNIVSKSGSSGVSSSSGSLNSKESSQKRPSVFERLGTKTSSSASQLSLTVSTTTTPQLDGFCRHWAQNGTCPYGKNCKLSSTHILISPSKRNSKKEAEQSKQVRNEKSSGSRSVHSAVVVRKSPEGGSGGVNWESWDQTELEYEDEKALEKRRQLLQRELDLQMKKEGRKLEQTPQQLSNRRSSSTSSCTSSSSSGSSSTGSTSTRSTSPGRKRIGVGAPQSEEKKKKKRHSTSSPSSIERNKKNPGIRSRSSSSKMVYKESPSRRVLGGVGGGRGGSSTIRKNGGSGDSPIGGRKSSGGRRTPPPLPPSRKPPSPPPKQKPPLPIPTSNSERGIGGRRKESSPRRGSKQRSPFSPRGDRRGGRTPSKSRHRSRGPRRRGSVRPRSIDRKKDDRGRKDDANNRRDRKSDFRDKREQEELRRKERIEALERCRERQREREREQLTRERRESDLARAKSRKDNRDRYDKEKEKRRESGIGGGEHGGGGEGRKERERSYVVGGGDGGSGRCGGVEKIGSGRKGGGGGGSPRDVVRPPDRYERLSSTNYDRRIDDKGPSSSSSPYPHSPPYRTSDRGRYESDRGDRVRSGSLYKEVTPPRDDSRMRMGQTYQDERRMRRGERGVGGGGGSGWDGRYDDGGNKPGRGSRAVDWESRDYQESRRDWESRNRRGGSDGFHSDEKEKLLGEKLVDQVDTTKRPRGGVEEESETKRPRLEETTSQHQPTTGGVTSILEEELSDISDGPDEILNREDTEEILMEEDGDGGNESLGAVPEAQQQDETSQLSTIVNIEQRILAESRITEEEGIDNLDFEEISDEELEEEAKANKCSLGDALGVDWASLIAECRPQKRSNQEMSAHRLWRPNSIFSRIGVSLELAGPELFNRIQDSLLTEGEGSKGEDKGATKLLSSIAGIHRALSDRKQRRRALLSGFQTLPKRALSARDDIYTRRRLCSLPAVSLESYPTLGLCQWVI